MNKLLVALVLLLPLLWLGVIKDKAPETGATQVNILKMLQIEAGHGDIGCNRKCGK